MPFLIWRPHRYSRYTSRALDTTRYYHDYWLMQPYTSVGIVCRGSESTGKGERFG